MEAKLSEMENGLLEFGLKHIGHVATKKPR
jgi:hypothetical protein